MIVTLTKQLFILIVFLSLTALTAYGQTDPDKPPKPKVNLIGVWFYNGVGGITDSSNFDSTEWMNYKSLPIKSNDTIEFVDSISLIVNHKHKYNYKFNFKWTDVELNDHKFWQAYIIIDKYEYFIHFRLNEIEMQNRIGNHRWYGRFKETNKKNKK